MKRSKQKQRWEVMYVVGQYDTDTNKCTYLKASGYNKEFGELSQASPMRGEDANRISQKNLYRGCKLVYKKDRKVKQLFVSKVVYNDDWDVIKLTKRNSFQLMEVVANNI